MLAMIKLAKTLAKRGRFEEADKMSRDAVNRLRNDQKLSKKP